MGRSPGLVAGDRSSTPRHRGQRQRRNPLTRARGEPAARELARPIVRFGGRAEETGLPNGTHRASARSKHQAPRTSTGHGRPRSAQSVPDEHRPVLNDAVAPRAPHPQPACRLTPGSRPELRSPCRQSVHQEHLLEQPEVHPNAVHLAMRTAWSGGPADRQRSQTERESMGSLVGMVLPRVVDNSRSQAAGIGTPVPSCRRPFEVCPCRLSLSEA